MMIVSGPRSCTLRDIWAKRPSKKMSVFYSFFFLPSAVVMKALCRSRGVKEGKKRYWLFFFSAVFSCPLAERADCIRRLCLPPERVFPYMRPSWRMIVLTIVNGLNNRKKAETRIENQEERVYIIYSHLSVNARAVRIGQSGSVTDKTFR